MCDVCRQIPCHPRCPNAPEPTAVLMCARCNSGIYAGDRYHNSEGGVLCMECIDDMSARDYMEFIGETTVYADDNNYAAA